MPWEYAFISVNYTNQTAPFLNHLETHVMIEPGGQQAAGTTNLYLVLATACEFSDTSIYDGPFGADYYYLLDDASPGTYYGGDVPLPPGWLQINGQTLVDTGLTNLAPPLGGWAGSFLNVTSLWGATVVSAPAGDPVDVTPVATRLYKNRDYTFNVLAYQMHMQILDADGNDLTLQTNTVIVGQQMNLTCQMVFTNSFFTNNFVLTNWQWTVPGVAISNYVVAEDSSSAMVVTHFPTTNASAIFYWVDGASNRVVQCSATVNGALITGQASFNVVKPTIDFIGITNTVVTLDNYFNSLPTNLISIHFGAASNNEYGIYHDGIQFLCTNVNTYGYPSGLYGFVSVQLILNHIVSYIKADGSTFSTNLAGLDNFYPYQALGDGDGSECQDAPGITFSTSLVQLATSEAFKMVLLFKSDSPSIAVPIKEVDWGWYGQATNIMGNWTLLPQSFAIITTNNQSTLSFPTWTNVVLNQEL
jgi:hypothetical protein